jgi:signal transduction histidine kinase
MDAQVVISDRTEALRQLRSHDQKQRLAAARFLSRNPSKSDANIIREVLASEDVYWIRAALQSVLRTLGEIAASDGTSFRNEKPLSVNLEDLLPSTVNEAARLLLHELRAPVGRLDAYASVEVPNFAVSGTNRELQQLKMKLEAIDRLGQATTSPVLAEFDLAELLENLARSFSTEKIEVLTQGQRPHLIVSDESLISFIVSSGLQNAVEASSRVLGRQVRGQVVVSWGAATEEHYVRILDDGRGIEDSFAELVKWGKTTKETGHGGYGLAIAYAAANSLSGRVHLENAKEKGARFDFRWRAQEG